MEKFISELRVKGLSVRIINVNTIIRYMNTLGAGVGGGGGRGSFGVILVRVCEPAFQNLPHSYTWPLKKRTHSYT